MKADRKTTKPIGRGKSKTQKTSPTHKTVSPKPHEKKTESKQAETALHSAEENYRSIFEQAPVGIFQSTPQGCFRNVNSAMAQIYGYDSPKQMITEITSIGDQVYVNSSTRQKFQRILAERGEIHNFLDENYRKDGSHIWTQTTARAIKDKDGNILFYEGFTLDVTERKQAERELSERSRLLEALFTNHLTSLVLLDRDFNFIRVNEAYARPTGRDVSEFPGHNHFEFYPSEARAFFEDVVRTKKPFQVSARPFVYADHPEWGVTYWDWTLVPILDRTGEVEFLVFSLNDITERKRAEEELRESEEKVRAITYTAQDAIIVLDGEGKISFWNPAADKIFGYRKDEAMGKELHLLLAPERYQDAYLRGFAGFKKTGEGAIIGNTIELEAIKKGGAEIDIELSLSAIELHGVWQAVGVVRDITERKQIDEALRKSEAELKEAQRVGRLGSWDWDAKTDTITWSEEYYHVYGFDPALHPPGYQEHLKAYTPESAARLDAAVKHSMETGQGYQVDLEQARPDGVRRWITARGEGKRDANNRISGFRGTAQDITERKQAEEQMRQRLAELEAIHTISTALRNAQTRDQAMPILLDETLAALETDDGAIWLYHADHDELRVAVSRGWFKQFDKTPMKPVEGIAGAVFASGQAHLTTEFARDPVLRPPIAGQFPAGWGGVCVPIRAGVITVGTLTVSLPPPRQITPEQVKLLESLAEMAGTTLHRMSLHEETVRQLDRLEALHSIDIAISASMDLHLTLNVLLEHVKTQLNADATDVLLLNPHLQTLEFAAGCGFRSRAVERTSLRIGEGQAGRAALERHMIQLPDFAASGAAFAQAELLAAENVASYFAVPLMAKGQVKGVLEVFHRTPLQPDSEWLNFLETLAGQTAIAIDSGQLFDALQRSNVDLVLAYDATIEGWSHALDLRDKETEGHTLRVTEITLRLAKAMGIGDAELVHVRHGALLHDIGKMGVPDEILLKPGKLTDEEWVLMRKHPQLAFELLSPIAYLRDALDIPYCHHEKWDGTGYPRGLKGEAIPLAARLFAIVDVWDALISDRPYRKAWTKEKTLQHIRELAGAHFDPNIIDICLAEFSKDQAE